jgi:DNA-binding NarL/FixJ family response regulator
LRNSFRDEGFLTLSNRRMDENKGKTMADTPQPDTLALKKLIDSRRAEVRKRHLGCRVLILSIHANGQLVVSALREGASGYLTKDSAPTELVHAVRKVAAGGRYVTEALADELAARLGQGGSADEAPPLSRREYTVLALLGAGRTPTEISSELSLSVKTVSSYRSRLLTKLGLRTTSQLVAYALRTGITPGAGPSCWTGTATR